MNPPNPKVVYIVVGTLALVMVSYALTLTYCSVMGVEPIASVLTAFKDLGIFCSGALAALLARTGSSNEPAKTEIVNSEQNPVKTEDVKS